MKDFSGFVYELIPNDGYALKSVKLDKKDLIKETDSRLAYNAIGYDNPICILSTDKKHSLEVTFAKKYKVITRLSNGGFFGMVHEEADGSLVQYVAKGNDFKVFFFTESGFKVKGATVNGKKAKIYEQNSNNYVLVKEINKDTVIDVTFEKINPNNLYTINVSASSNGTISPNKKVKINEGGSKIFEIKPKEGYMLKSVTIDGDKITDPVLLNLYLTDGLEVKNVLKNGTIKVEFAKKYTISASASEGGGIGTTFNMLREKQIDVAKGTTYTVYAACEAGYRVKSVIVDGKIRKTNDSEIKLKNINKNHIVRFEFEKIDS